MQESVLDLVVGRSLEIDVEIVIEDTGEVRIQEEYTGETEDSMFHMDNDDEPHSPLQQQGRISNKKAIGKSRSGSVDNERESSVSPRP